jgi:SAM-dependent methyltransferase
MPDQIDLSVMQSVPVVGPYGNLRLHRYWREPSGKLWDDIWSKTPSRDYWKAALQGALAQEYSRLFLKYLSKGSRLLEAGCGVGQVVLALRARGFDCYGIDYAENVISLLNNEFPNVPFMQADIRSIPISDGHFDGYISLGVIEHFVDGQREILAEAARVLKRGGHIFVSVPALNCFRKLRCDLGTYDKQADLPFFESCISVDELRSLLRETGFEPLEVSYTNTVMTFVQETAIRPLYRHIEDLRYVRGAVDRLIRSFLPKPWFGHMLMIVGRKI